MIRENEITTLHHLVAVLRLPDLSSSCCKVMIPPPMWFLLQLANCLLTDSSFQTAVTYTTPGTGIVYRLVFVHSHGYLLMELLYRIMPFTSLSHIFRLSGSGDRTHSLSTISATTCPLNLFQQYKLSMDLT